MNIKFSKQIVILIVLVLISCNGNKDKANVKSQKDSAEKDLVKTKIQSENFEDFNKKFHADSLFQVSRVDFPIEGKHISGFEQHEWTRKNWQFQVIPVAEGTEIGEYEHSVVKTDSLVTEKFWIPDSGFEVERQFKLINNKWFLIFYNDINL
ncbi:hypothetical protein HNP37_002018 [Flavobacterium nitrogenifigens]|uniref:DUF4348 domain-containing protein n=2 Tax=Flavobacterium TaxID=237 RepID=A0A7W7IXJ6_9FLAO|nr:MULTISPECIES: hypothetical protein [Flavobacterium]MBB4801957.1 hypothetical protein [Flavobacterium nitrogenifigens]MBB6386915.1 hypothetical protein [Flavobacterium notoginsengisoli]